MDKSDNVNQDIPVEENEDLVPEENKCQESEARPGFASFFRRCFFPVFFRFFPLSFPLRAARLTEFERDQNASKNKIDTEKSTFDQQNVQPMRLHNDLTSLEKNGAHKFGINDEEQSNSLNNNFKQIVIGKDRKVDVDEIKLVKHTKSKTIPVLFGEKKLANLKHVSLSKTLDNSDNQRKAFSDDMHEQHFFHQGGKFTNNIPELHQIADPKSVTKSKDPETVNYQATVFDFCKPGQETESCMFTVYQNGCTVKAHYCIIHFPPGAVQQDIEIKMTPMYYYSDFNLPDRAFISPFVKFESKLVMKFLKNVEVNLYTSYSAADVKWPVRVQIMRKTGTNIEQDFRTVSLNVERYITFMCTHFCLFGSHVSISQRHNLKRRYYCAGCVQDQMGMKSLIITALVYEDIPDTRELNLRYLNGRQEILPPECFTVGHPGHLEVQLKKYTTVEIRSPEEKINLIEYFGEKLDKKFQFRLEAFERISSQGAILSLQYQIKIHTDNNLVDTKLDKKCYLLWKNEAENPGISNPSGGARSKVVTTSRHPNVGDIRSGTSQVADDEFDSKAMIPDYRSEVEQAKDSWWDSD